MTGTAMKHGKNGFLTVPVILNKKILPENFSHPNNLIAQLPDKKVVDGIVVCLKWPHILSAWKTFYNLQNGRYLY